METKTAPEGAPNSQPPAEDGLTPDLRAVRDGAKLSDKEERGALAFLLGPTTALQYTVKAQVDTDEGLKELRFRIQQLDAALMDKIDAANRRGEGPFAKLDVAMFNAEVCAEATLWFEDATGRRVDAKGQEFLGGVPSPALAMLTRFKYQPGILESVKDQVQAISGYSSDRVGTAQRALVESGKH